MIQEKSIQNTQRVEELLEIKLKLNKKLGI